MITRWFDALTQNRPAKGRRKPVARPLKLQLERLEDRALMAADANLVAYRPITQYINYALYPVADALETDPKQGPGIRANGDDDNANGRADFSDVSTAAAGDNDLVRVDVLGTGTSFNVGWTGALALWSSPNKTTAIPNGGAVTRGQSLWVEYTSLTHTVGTSTALTLSVSESSVGGTTTASDSVVFHSFRSIVIAIGGNTQDPSKFGDPNLGTFTMAGTLYNQGYDVHMFAHGAVKSSGQGAAYNEVVSAVLKRNVDYAAIFGYSWGGGATYELASGLKANTALKPAGFQLQYTAYVDGIKHGSTMAETRLPVGTAYHDNFYQRKELLLRGNAVTGANNVNVSQTSWGSALKHTTIDDHATLRSQLLANLTSRVTV